MSEMVDCVAKALFEHNENYLCPKPMPWEEVPESWREEWRKRARAAIEAMRRPTLPMIYAGADTFRTGPLTEQPRKSYEAIIDEALK